MNFEIPGLKTKKSGIQVHIKRGLGYISYTYFNQNCLDPQLAMTNVLLL